MQEASSKIYGIIKELRSQKILQTSTYAAILTKPAKVIQNNSKTTKFINQTKAPRNGSGFSTEGSQTVIISPLNNEEFPALNLEELKESIKLNIKPTDLGLKVSGVFTTKSSVCVKVTNSTQGSRLKEALECAEIYQSQGQLAGEKKS